MTADPSIAGATPPTNPEPPPWRPRGHLVGWAAGLLAVAVAVLGTSATFGLLAPRVSTDHGVTHGRVPDADDLVYAIFEVRNDAYGTARLTGADASVPGMRVDTASFAPLDGGTARVDGAVDLGHGESAWVTIRWYVTDCELLPADPAPIGLEIRTPVGLTRTVDAASVSDLMGTAVGAAPGDESDPGWARAVAGEICPP